MGHAKNCASGDCLCHRYKAQLKDKYTPIPGEMDTIDCLRKERDELRAENAGMQKRAKDGAAAARSLYEACAEELDRKNKQIGELVAAIRLMPCTCHAPSDYVCKRCEVLRSVGQSKKCQCKAVGSGEAAGTLTALCPIHSAESEGRGK